MYPADSNFKLIKRRYIHCLFGIMIVSFALFFILAFFHVFSIHSPNASAVSDSSSMSVNVDPNLSISSNDVAIVGTPDPNGSWLSGSSNIVVSTNNGTGYTLYMSSSNNVVDLVNSSDSSKKIYSLSSSTTENDFKTNLALRNHYGFTYDNSSTYYPITTVSNPTTIKTTHDNTNYDTTNVTFSTMADRAIPSGTYTGEVIFTALANTNPDVFMQDFGTNECNALDEWSYDSTTGTVHEGDTVTLWDKRDNNSYKVRKLADGNCWMTQNLRLSAESLTANSHSTTLDSSDTDLSSTTFTVPASAEWDSLDGTNPHVIRAQDAPVGKKSSEGGTPISEPTATYRGTYYNWPAAVANGTIPNTTSTTYTTSICPKGWKLPTGEGTIEGTSTTTTNQFQTLYEAYNSNKTNLDKELHYYNGNNSATYAGYWYPGYVYLLGSGSVVNFWSSTTSTTAGNAWNLNENSSSGINPADNGYRGNGFSVRCILNTN